MGTLTLCKAEALLSFEKSLLSACLRYERNAKFQPSRTYGLGCGMIGTFTFYIIIIHHEVYSNIESQTTLKFNYIFL
jgi:hypothetical protein